MKPLSRNPGSAPGSYLAHTDCLLYVDDSDGLWPWSQRSMSFFSYNA